MESSVSKRTSARLSAKQAQQSGVDSHTSEAAAPKRKRRRPDAEAGAEDVASRPEEPASDAPGARKPRKQSAAAASAAAAPVAPAAAAATTAAPAVAAAAPAEPEERRLAPYQRKPPVGYAARLQRALGQRLYLISRTDVGPLEKRFVVLGSVGNVYDVVVSHRPSCNCPDFLKGYLCKHLLFVYLRVLRVDRRSTWLYQKAFLSAELREMFDNAPPAPAAVLASKKVVKRYEQITTGKDEVEDAEDEGPIKRRPLEDDCPVCYEPMLADEATVWCKTSCGNSVHADCFRRWAQSKKAAGVQVTCVWCRAVWPDDEERRPGAAPMEHREGYMNLGAHQPGLPTERPEWGWRRGSF